MKLKKEKINFVCEKCGDCCRVDGYVFLKKNDIIEASKYLEVTPAEFRKRFTDWFLFLGRVIKHDLGGCCFLVEGRCIIYPARPIQCSSFPWWNRVLKNKKEWEHISTYCRGAKAAKFIE